VSKGGKTVLSAEEGGEGQIVRTSSERTLPWSCPGLTWGKRGPELIKREDIGRRDSDRKKGNGI